MNSTDAERSRQQIDRELDHVEGLVETTIDLVVEWWTILDALASGNRPDGRIVSVEQQHRAAAAIGALLALPCRIPTGIVINVRPDELVAFEADIAAALATRDRTGLSRLVSDMWATVGARVLDTAAPGELTELTSADRTRHLRYMNRGRFGDLRDDNGVVLRMFDRGDYYSNHTAMGCAFAVDGTGRQLVVAGSDWDKLSIYDAGNGELVAGPFGDGDPFIGRLIADPTGRHLASDVWAWHPVSYIRLADIDRLLDGDLGRSLDVGIDYLFDRPMCWVTTPNGPIFACAGTSIDDREVAAAAPGDVERLDVALQVELFTADGTAIAVVDVAGGGAVTFEQLDTCTLVDAGDATLLFSFGEITDTVDVAAVVGRRS